MSNRIFALMGMFAALNGGNYPGKGTREISQGLTERIMRERRDKGLKPSYIEKPVKSYMGKKKVSRKKRKSK